MCPSPPLDCELCGDGDCGSIQVTTMSPALGTELSKQQILSDLWSFGSTGVSSTPSAEPREPLPPLPFLPQHSSLTVAESFPRILVFCLLDGSEVCNPLPLLSSAEYHGPKLLHLLNEDTDSPCPPGMLIT